MKLTVHTQRLGGIRLRTSYTWTLEIYRKFVKEPLNNSRKKKTGGGTIPHLTMVGQVLPGSGEGPAAGFGEHVKTLTFFISWITITCTKIVSQSVRPQWLGFWKHFYRPFNMSLVNMECPWKPNPRTDLAHHDQQTPGLPPRTPLQWVQNADSSSVTYARCNFRNFYLWS